MMKAGKEKTPQNKKSQAVSSGKNVGMKLNDNENKTEKDSKKKKKTKCC